MERVRRSKPFQRNFERQRHLNTKSFSRQTEKKNMNNERETENLLNLDENSSHRREKDARQPSSLLVA